jgi:mono/diheme cytochrome c family protein
MNSDPNASNTPQEIEPTAGSARAPVWLFVLVAMLAFWGMGFLDNHGGGFHAMVYKPYKSLAELEADQPRSKGDIAFLRGKGVYDQTAKCLLCHQPNGMGSVSPQSPPLAGSEWVLAKEPGRVIRIVLDGLQGPVTVNGRQFESAGMPPWKSLTDEQIADVLTYIRGNKEWGNDAPPVTAEQVKAIRDKTAARSSQYFVDELLKVNENE